MFDLFLMHTHICSKVDLCHWASIQTLAHINMASKKVAIQLCMDQQFASSYQYENDLLHTLWTNGKNKMMACLLNARIYVICQQLS